MKTQVRISEKMFHEIALVILEPDWAKIIAEMAGTSLQTLLNNSRLD